MASLESDMLLKVGPTSSDGLLDLLSSSQFVVEIQWAMDHSEQVVVRPPSSDPDTNQLRIADRPWGVFIGIGRGWGWYQSHLEGGIGAVVDSISDTAAEDWQAVLPSRLKLKEFNIWEFQKVGNAELQKVLLKHGWRKLSVEEHNIVVQEQGLKLHSFECVPIDVSQTFVNGQSTQLSTHSVEMFPFKQSQFWSNENKLRRAFAETLAHYGTLCTRIYCIRVNHGSYMMQIPESGWHNIADSAWPLCLTAEGGRAIVFAPELKEGIVVHGTNQTVTGYGQQIACRFVEILNQVPNFKAKDSTHPCPPWDKQCDGRIDS